MQVTILRWGHKSQIWGCWEDPLYLQLRLQTGRTHWRWQRTSSKQKRNCSHAQAPRSTSYSTHPLETQDHSLRHKTIWASLKGPLESLKAAQWQPRSRIQGAKWTNMGVLSVRVPTPGCKTAHKKEWFRKLQPQMVTHEPPTPSIRLGSCPCEAQSQAISRLGSSTHKSHLCLIRCISATPWLEELILAATWPSQASTEILLPLLWIIKALKSSK